MRDLAYILYAMNSLQLAMALVFVAGYGLALGALIETRARVWSAAVATLAAVGFVLLARDWIPALLLVALVIGVFGVLIALTWSVAWLAQRQLAASAQDDRIDAANSTAAPPASQHGVSRPGPTATPVAVSPDSV
jgi:hypothetical protein